MGIGGSEWIIIGLISIFLLFGSKKLPDITRNIGKAIGEYNNTKQSLLKEVNKVKVNNSSFDDHNNEKNLYFGKMINGPVLTEREKLEIIAISLKIDYLDMSDEQLRLIILKKMKNDNF